MQAVIKMSNLLEKQLVIQYNNYMNIKLLNTLHAIERTISLAFSDIVNLEIFSNSELTEIMSHLKVIYTQTELPKLDKNMMFTILEFSKFRVVSINKIITCILYIPILHNSFYQYSRIYPIADRKNRVLLPPYRYHLQNAEGEFWTNEKCNVFDNQIICVEVPVVNKC